MGKQPAFQFYPADWLRDPKLQMVSMSSQGVWINFLCAMWYSDIRGEITGSVPDLCRLIGCNRRELKRFLDENGTHKFADVVESNGSVTVINRRMRREEKAREDNRKRVGDWRGKQ